MKHIYLADDDMDDQELFQAATSGIAPDALVKCANSCEDLLENLEHANPVPDIIFLDINMPRMNGHDCLQKIIENNSWKGIPVIMYSTSKEDADIEKAFKYGAMHYLSKPADFQHLENALKTILSNDFSTHSRSRENFLLLHKPI